MHIFSNKSNPLHSTCKCELVEDMCNEMRKENMTAEQQLSFLFRFFTRLVLIWWLCVLFAVFKSLLCAAKKHQISFGWLWCIQKLCVRKSLYDRSAVVDFLLYVLWLTWQISNTFFDVSYAWANAVQIVLGLWLISCCGIGLYEEADLLFCFSYLQLNNSNRSTGI